MTWFDVFVLLGIICVLASYFVHLLYRKAGPIFAWELFIPAIHFFAFLFAIGEKCLAIADYGSDENKPSKQHPTI